jgi:dienelactone hydrolase
MATVLLFHHALGQTPGFFAFADALRAAGHTVHTPDLFDGKTFASIEEGLAHVEQLGGFEQVLRRGKATADGLPADLVYAGFSLGVLPAQALAQTRPGARGAILCYSCVPHAMFSPAWPEGVPVEIHIKEDDDWAAEDRDAARALAAAAPEAELFLYPGTGHYFADASFAHYDAVAAGVLMERTLRFLQRVGSA